MKQIIAALIAFFVPTIQVEAVPPKVIKADQIVTSGGTIDFSSGSMSVATGGTGSTSYTLGSFVFYDGTKLGEDNANLFWDTTNKRIGIGTTTPSFKIHTKSSGAPSIAVERVDSSATSGSYVLRKARGTIGAESALSLNDSIGSVSFFGYGATTYGSTPSGLLSASTQEAFTDTARGTRVVISTTPNGSATLVSSLAVQDSTIAIGRGFSNSAPTSIIIKGTDVSSGTANTASGSVTLQSGVSTGNQAGGDILFKISPAGLSGSSQNSALDRFKLQSDGAVKFYSPDSSKTIDLYVSNSATSHSYTMPTAQGASGSFLKNDGSGNLSWDTAGAGTHIQESFAGDGLNTMYILSQIPVTAASLKVYVNGLILTQGSGEDYTISSNQVTFTIAPVVGAQVLAVYIY